MTGIGGAREHSGEVWVATDTHMRVRLEEIEGHVVMEIIERIPHS